MTTTNVMFAAEGTDNQQTKAGTPVLATPTIIVIASDEDTPASGVLITFAVASGGGSLSGDLAVTTNASGIAAMDSWTLGTTPGINVVTATNIDTEGSPVSFQAMGGTEFTVDDILEAALIEIFPASGTINATTLDSIEINQCLDWYENSTTFISGNRLVFPWDTIFLSWLFNSVNRLDLIGGDPVLYAVELAHYFRDEDLWGNIFMPGAIAFFNFERDEAFETGDLGVFHAALCYGMSADGKLITIEGDTSNTSTTEGGLVLMRTDRKLSDIVGFGYPLYDTTPETIQYLVPNVVGMNAIEGYNLIDETHFYPELVYLISDSYDDYLNDFDFLGLFTIIEQSPPLGIMAYKNSTVILSVRLTSDIEQINPP